jgi:hypothetical protein
MKQHVTKPGLPQVECAAHFLTNPEQLLFLRTAFACSAAQLTNAPWRVPLQGQCSATAVRAFAMSLLSGSVVGSQAA